MTLKSLMGNHFIYKFTSQIGNNFKIPIEIYVIMAYIYKNSNVPAWAIQAKGNTSVSSKALFGKRAYHMRT